MQASIESQPPIESQPLIELRGITRIFQNGEIATQVLHGVDLTIYPGEFVAIMEDELGQATSSVPDDPH